MIIKKEKLHVWYNIMGDQIEVTWERGSLFGDWINHFLTVMRDLDTDEIKGFTIHNVKEIIEKSLKEE